jgi:hypothetical protein
VLGEQIGTDRVIVQRVAMSERDRQALQARLLSERDELEEMGIFSGMSGAGIDGFEIEYTAWDPEAAERTLRERYGESVNRRWRGATLHTFSPFPFASWHAEDDQLHVFYGLPHNGERPGGCQAFEDERTVVVALTIKDWRGAKTLVGGFTPSHATVRLDRPLSDRVVIDDSANRVRPHWTAAP